MPPLLTLNPKLWVIYMLRDPRDVIVSRHQAQSDVFWTNLRLWRRSDYYRRKVMAHPRFILVKYEDLVTNPDSVQEQISKRMGFLTQTTAFSQFHQQSTPSEHSQQALNGLRPIDNQGVARWRSHKGRVASQISIHGAIDQVLIELGYETDHHWTRELPDSVDSNYPSKAAEQISQFARLSYLVRIQRKVLAYRIRHWFTKKT